MSFLKWIGGGLGWALGGPMGAMIGYAIGTMIDGSGIKMLGPGEQKKYEGPKRGRTSARGRGSSRGRDQYYKDRDKYRHHTQKGDFTVSLIALYAAVMKADGRVLKSELSHVKKYLSKQFGSDASKEYLKVLKRALDEPFNLRTVGMDIRYNMEHPLRLQLLHYLFGVAKADNHLHKREIATIRQISGYLGISSRDYNSIESMFFNKRDNNYKILGIEKSATDDEVKKAYRKMAKKYHPDKLAKLGPDVQKGAKEKFQSIQDAYETIKDRRGMK